MSYSIDFSKVSLEEYRKVIQEKNFIPSRQILKDKLDIHFSAFEKAKIKNIQELLSIICNKKSKADYEDLYKKVTLKNEEIKLYKGKIGLNDMKLCIEAAKSIDAEIEV